jgi:hypothetical protein
LASVPTAEESARRILAIFSAQNVRAGEVLMQGSVNTQFLLDGSARDADYALGLEFAITQGWLEMTPNAILLTNAGFSEM